MLCFLRMLPPLPARTRTFFSSIGVRLAAEALHHKSFRNFASLFLHQMIMSCGRENRFPERLTHLLCINPSTCGALCVIWFARRVLLYCALHFLQPASVSSWRNPGPSQPVQNCVSLLWRYLWIYWQSKELDSKKTTTRKHLFHIVGTCTLLTQLECKKVLGQRPPANHTPCLWMTSLGDWACYHSLRRVVSGWKFGNATKLFLVKVHCGEAYDHPTSLAMQLDLPENCLCHVWDLTWIQQGTKDLELAARPHVRICDNLTAEKWLAKWDTSGHAMVQWKETCENLWCLYPACI